MIGLLVTKGLCFLAREIRPNPTEMRAVLEIGSVPIHIVEAIMANKRTLKGDGF